MSAANYRLAKHDLFAAIHEQQMGASPMVLVDAIESFVLAAITEAFRAHPVTGTVDGSVRVPASATGSRS